MRITPAAKEETRERIIAAAIARFREQGFAAATTRDIAHQAGIATGTLFNYFPSKEAIVLALAADSLAATDDALVRDKRTAASLEEDLFAYIAAGLRRLKRHRAYLGVVVQTALSPLVAANRSGDLDSIRELHLGRVEQILAAHGVPEPSSMAVQLYWTLYLGILAYWIGDHSPKQEDSLVLIDQSVSMFCDWLRRERDRQSPAESAS